MAMEQDIVIISFYMRDAPYGRFCGGRPYPKFIPLAYKFKDYSQMRHKIPEYILRLR